MMAILTPKSAVLSSVVSVAAQVSSSVLPAFADTQVHFGKRSICFRVARPVWETPVAMALAARDMRSLHVSHMLLGCVKYGRLSVHLCMCVLQDTKAERMLISIPLSAVNLVQCRVAPLQQSCLVLTVHLGRVSATLQALCASPALVR